MRMKCTYNAEQKIQFNLHLLIGVFAINSLTGNQTGYLLDCRCEKDWAIAAGLAAVVLASKTREAEVVFVVDMDSFHHSQAWLLLFLTETIDQNTSMVGCCCNVWGDQVLLSSTGSVVCHHCWHVTLPVVSPQCKAQPVAHDGLGCSFASVHVERESNIAKSMCASLHTDLREASTVTSNTAYVLYDT